MLIFIIAALFGSMALGSVLTYAAGYIRMRKSSENFISARTEKGKNSYWIIVAVLCIGFIISAFWEYMRLKGNNEFEYRFYDLLYTIARSVFLLSVFYLNGIKHLPVYISEKHVFGINGFLPAEFYTFKTYDLPSKNYKLFYLWGKSSKSAEYTVRAYYSDKENSLAETLQKHYSGDTVKIVKRKNYVSTIVEVLILAAVTAGALLYLKFGSYILIGDCMVRKNVKDISFNYNYVLEPYYQADPYYKTEKLSNKNIKKLKNVYEIESLDIWNHPVSDFSFLSDHSEIKKLKIGYAGFDSPFDYSPVAELKNLEELAICDSGKTTDYSFIMKMNNLRKFKIYTDNMSTELTDILSSVPDLYSLDLWNCKVNEDVTFDNLDNITELNLSSTDNENYDFIVGMDNLKKLDLSYTKAENYDCLTELPELKYLNLSGTKACSYDFLKEMNKLEELNLKYCENPDYYILLEMDSLNVLHADIEIVPEELIPLLEGKGIEIK